MSRESVDCGFLEVEHKFLVDQDFDLEAFFAKLRALGPESDYETTVEDTYFLAQALPHHVFRHRCDKFIQQLTLKSLTGDNEARVEVNLDLGHHKGHQGSAAEAFLQPLGIDWKGTLTKFVQVFYFVDVEVVFYQAIYGTNTQKCLEIEARRPKSLQEAKNSLQKWEEILGIDPSTRSHKSILEILVLPTLSQEIQNRLRSVL